MLRYFLGRLVFPMPVAWILGGNVVLLVIGSTTEISNLMDCSAVLYIYIHGVQRVNHKCLGDAPTFAAVLPEGQSFRLSCEIFQHLLVGLAQNCVLTFMVSRG